MQKKRKARMLVYTTTHGSRVRGQPVTTRGPGVGGFELGDATSDVTATW